RRAACVVRAARRLPRGARDVPPRRRRCGAAHRHAAGRWRHAMTRLLSGWMLVVLALVGPLRAEEEQHDAGEKVFTIAEFQAHGVTLATAGAGDVDVGVQLPGEVRPN